MLSRKNVVSSYRTTPLSGNHEKYVRRGPRLTRVEPVGYGIDAEDFGCLYRCFASQPCRQACTNSEYALRRCSECQMERCSPLLRSLVKQ